MILEVPDHYAPVYDRAGNMQRLGPEPELEPQADDLSVLTVKDLRNYADAHGIDLGDAVRKPDILAAIEAAEADSDEEAED
jgi:hypothetical protein